VLKPHAEQTLLIYCANCKITLGVDDTGIDEHPLASQSEWPAIPGFKLLGILGEGGMGIVYRAYEEGMDREVAIKVLPPALAANPDLLLRFQNEARVIRELVAPHILQVYAVGKAQGVPYIVMPRIEGGNLLKILRARAEIKAGSMPQNAHPWALLDDRTYLERILPVLDQITEAVTALHHARVVHRDIKPNNVLVDLRGDAWVGDFGLARKELESVGTRQGQGMGTPGYASPEQLAGKGPLDFRSDIFSLGATLYEAITLRLPYGKYGPKPDSADPARPSRVQRSLSRDFDAVLLKCLQLNSIRRYDSMEEMRKDWRRVRSGLLPEAKLAGPLERAGRWIRRRPIAATSAAVIVLLLATLGAILTHDPTIYRTVHVATNPPGAKIVLVPIHPDTGFPLDDDQKWIYPAGVTPLTIRRAPVGEYIVEAQLADKRFQEVYRLIPRPAQIDDNPECRHRTWNERTDGSIDMPTITIPPGEVTDSMARFEGGDFTMGAANLPTLFPHPRWVPAFYLDPTEITVAEYRRIKKGLPSKLKGKNALENDAITYVSFDHALDCAEKMGKRLPYEDEYEYAATGGGSRLFPWGNDASRITSWPIGEVRKPGYDRTPTNPPVYGLFSGVVEWTLSWPNPYPGTDARTLAGYYSPEVQEMFHGARIVRGGPFPVVLGNPDPLGKDKQSEWDPRWRHSISRDLRHPGLGFRCARSAAPRFMK
jgi:formylglycine-generating enzyme required for sulfatase activity